MAEPTIRMVQAIVYQGRSPQQPTYASGGETTLGEPLFESALDLTVCVRDLQSPNHAGLCLITTKGSRQAGLTGLKGVIVRKVAVDKTRCSLEKALASIKQKLEFQVQ